MKVLAAGLDQTTIAFMRSSGIAVEAQEVEDAADLVLWLKDGLYDATVMHLEQSSLGIFMARDLRAKKILTPLLGISCGSETRPWPEHRAIFLENGGDDLLRDPANPRELVASLRAITRRQTGVLLDIVEFENGGARMKVNFTTKAVRVNGDVVRLTGKEMALIMLMASHPDRVLSKEMAISQMYTEGIDDEPEFKIIDVYIYKLRVKLAVAHPDAVAIIETVWGRGYVIREKMRVHEPRAEAA